MNELLWKLRFIFFNVSSLLKVTDVRIQTRPTNSREQPLQNSMLVIRATLTAATKSARARLANCRARQTGKQRTPLEKRRTKAITSNSVVPIIGPKGVRIDVTGVDNRHGTGF
mgnify:CR=1 FL=1